MAKLSASELGLPERVPCPFCDGQETELHSAFGSQLSVATYWCRRCATPFECFRLDDAAGSGNGENRPGAEGVSGGAGTPSAGRAKSSEAP